MKTIFRNLIIAALFLIVPACNQTPGGGEPSDVDHYTCTMHPSVHSKDPGKCPICSMDLVPVMKRGADGASPTLATPPDKSRGKSDAMKDMPGMGNMPGMPGMKGTETKGAKEKPGEFVVPVERQQQIGVTYATVETKPLRHGIRAVGRVVPETRQVWSFVARVDGYVQQLFVTSPGEMVEKDAPLISIYSPELLTTERELVMLLQMRDGARTTAVRATPEQLIAAAKSRLGQWNVTEEQITELEKTRQPNEVLTLRSPFRGVVQQVPVKQGMSVKIGDLLVEVADLSAVWVWGEFYQDELPMLRIGQEITVTSSSYPGEEFKGRLSLIDPFIDDTKRTGRVRLDIQNPDLKLKPDMYVDLLLEMDMGKSLVVPVSAVMPTGKRNIAFVDKGNGKLEPRLLVLGGKYGDVYAVTSGLKEGERVVASANFLIDAEAKIQGALKSW
jgi:membrane fusion protein, copper/silver efflux system